MPVCPDNSGILSARFRNLVRELQELCPDNSRTLSGCPKNHHTDEVDYRKCKWIHGKYDTSELEKIYTADRKRCALVLESVNRYVTDMDEVKGLGFCVSVNHAQYMADYFNEHGVPSIALSAKSIDYVRSSAKKNLVDGTIKFIFVVDLYNEGVDIPQVNMEGLSC